MSNPGLSSPDTIIAEIGGEAGVLLLPGKASLHGPATRSRINKTLGLWTLFIVVGAVLALGFPRSGLDAFGLGLVAPGAGFLLHGGMHGHGLLHIMLFMLSMGFFAMAVFMWFATGNILLAPLVWFLTACSAGLMQGPAEWPVLRVAVPVLALAGVAFIFAGMYVRGITAKRARDATNAKLRVAVFQPVREENTQKCALSLEDAARVRFLFDRALQPVNFFEGFEWLDQFQTAAVRYQINFCAYALATIQARYAPALAGPFNEAQLRLNAKLSDHRIWSYWRLENIWGNLDVNPDPCRRENIMYTGFGALQMAMAQAASPLSASGVEYGLQLRDRSGRNFAYSFADLVRITADHMAASPFGLIACEPNWIYPICNTIGASSIRAYDTQFDLRRWENLMPHFRTGLEAEFIDATGRFVSCRSARTGFGFPMVGGIMPQAMPCFFLNAIMPDVALRQWLLVRERIWHAGKLDRKAFWPVDTGNYRFSRAAAYAATALAANEMGDCEIAVSCLDALDEECPAVTVDGVTHRPAASVWAHAVEICARAGQRNEFSKLIGLAKPKEGPYIKSLTYPEAICLSARRDNNNLTAVIAPQSPGQELDVAFGGLKPGKNYRLAGHSHAAFTASAQGEWLLSIRAQPQHELKLVLEL